MKRVLSFLLVAAAMMAFGAIAHSGDAAKKASKAKFLVISPHTAESCLAALDEINAMNSKALATWDFGCKEGDHTGYTMITAVSEEEVKAALPTHAKESKIVKLSKFTSADLKMAHQEMDKK